MRAAAKVGDWRGGSTSSLVSEDLCEGIGGGLYVDNHTPKKSIAAVA